MKQLLFGLNFLLILFFFSIANCQDRPFQFRVSYSKFANLTYQLDCLTDFTYCRKDDYQALWDKEFLKTAEDRAALEDWKKIRRRYTTSAEIENKIKLPLIQRPSEVDLADKIAIAGLQAADMDDYLSRLDLLVIPREREEFERVVRHFHDAFSAWWEKEAKEKGAGFANKIVDLLKKPAIDDNVARFYNFYQPYLPPNYAVTFDLFYRPNLVRSGSSGRALENHLLVEFLPNEAPERRIDVVLHEFCHFMLNNILLEKQSELQNAFLQSGHKTAIPAFNLMDETLATALGNGIIARSFSKPDDWQKYVATDRSFYNNPNIDRAAKTVLPFLDDWLAKNGRLNDPAFVELYIAALEKAFGEHLSSPQLFLGQAYLFIDEKFDESMRRNVRQTLNIASLYSEQADLAASALKDYNDNPNMSSIFIVQPAKIGQLLKKRIVTAKDLSVIQHALKTDKKALYSVVRNKNAYTFIVVAESDETAKKLVGDLAAAPTAFSGKYAATTAHK